MIILTYANTNNNRKLIKLLNKYGNFIFHDYNYHCEYKSFKDYFIRYHYCINYLKSISYLNYSGNYHREYVHEPAIIYYHENGQIKNKEYFLNGEHYYYNEFTGVQYDYIFFSDY